MSAGDLKLDYLQEASAVMDGYHEDVYVESDEASKRTPTHTLVEVIACALLSIAESLHRIVEEESSPSC